MGHELAQGIKKIVNSTPKDFKFVSLKYIIRVCVPTPGGGGGGGHLGI